MKITTELLKEYNACEKQVKHFAKAYPDGVKASGENAVLLAAEGFNVLWAVNLLPQEGLGSRRAFALWCAEQVAHLTKNPKIKQCLEIVKAEVLQPGSQNLAAAQDTVWSAARDAIRDANLDTIRSVYRSASQEVFYDTALNTARDAAWAAAWSAAWYAAWSADRSADRNAAWSAARSAALSATQDATRGAILDAAWSAAWSAAWNTARESQIYMLGEMLKEL